MRLLRLVLALSLGVSALLALVFTLRWPLVGDASLIHSIAFLIERGWAPYRDLGDMNMPGSFLIELAAMHLFGPGALAWRLFDFTLLGAASAAFFALLGRRNWFAALFASSLFCLIHLRDGLAQGGQRDLTMAVCLLAATAFLSSVLRRERTGWTAAAFGLFSGVALTIKPTTALFTAAELLLAFMVVRRSSEPAAADESQDNAHSAPLRWLLGTAAAGYLVAPAVALVFLLREHALSAFLAGFHGIVPFYASLGHRPLGYILLHSVSPVISLVLLWLAAVALDPSGVLRPQPGLAAGLRGASPPASPTAGRAAEPSTLQRPDARVDPLRAMLLLGALFGLGNCIVQARALPYYRYPLLAFLLPLLALDFTRIAGASRVSGKTPQDREARAAAAFAGRTAPPAGALRAHLARILAAAALLVGSLFLAPQSAVLIHRYRWWQTDFLTSLEDNLIRLGGQRLSGHIQCIDSVSGCGTALYDLRLEPATGVLSDFLLFGNGADPADPESVPIVRETRARFVQAIVAHPPQVIVVTSHLHLDGPDHYLKLGRWPALQAFLDAHYTLATDWTPTRTNRWWSREELPAGYRIYTLRKRVEVQP